MFWVCAKCSMIVFMFCLCDSHWFEVSAALSQKDDVTCCAPSSDIWGKRLQLCSYCQSNPIKHAQTVRRKQISFSFNVDCSVNNKSSVAIVLTGRSSRVQLSWFSSVHSVGKNHRYLSCFDLQTLPASCASCFPPTSSFICRVWLTVRCQRVLLRSVSGGICCLAFCLSLSMWAPRTDYFRGCWSENTRKSGSIALMGFI